MKYIILAAGRGTRMGEYTETIPKGILLFGKYPLLTYHIENAKRSGVTNIIVVKGYKEELIQAKGVTYYINQNYDKTNMVESLMLARKEFDEDIVVAYGDIIYNGDILEGLVSSPGNFVVTVDINWKKYWLKRYGRIDFDTESLLISSLGVITELGKPNPPPEKMNARYVGLLKFSKEGLDIISKIYDENPTRWKTAYMTDLLQELIDRKHQVLGYKISNSWLEFDTKEDYEKSTKWINDGTLTKLGL